MGRPEMEPVGIDLATGFGNRAALDRAAKAGMATAVRDGYAFALVVIALTPAQDASRRDRSISLAMRASLRATDQVFRVDDELLVALLPMAAGRVVGAVMERAARLVDQPFAWGAAFAGLDGMAMAELIDRAAGRLRWSF